LLGSIYQPGDSYESPRDAFQYLQGATTRALAKHFEILAAKWMADAPPVAEGSPTAWATTIKGDAIRDVETERRGVAFELLGAEEESQSGPAMSLPHVKGLKLLGDQVDLQGGIVHQVFSWSLQDIGQGKDTQPKERIEDVVQRVLMTAA
jgi:mediator of RNA polymerase II transcription subunit 17